MPIVSNGRVPRGLTNRSAARPGVTTRPVTTRGSTRSTTFGPVDAAPDGRLVEIERWFVQRGLPHFIERTDDEAFHGAWNRALPILVVAYLLLGLNALDLENWSWAQNLLASLFVVATLLVTWVVSNRLQRRPLFARPQQIDRPELVLFLIGPAIPVLAFGQFFDAFQTVLLGAALLAAHLPLVVVRRRADAALGRRARTRSTHRSRPARGPGTARCCCCSPRSCSSTPRCGRSPAPSTGCRTCS